jgi:hypothetical protein
MMSDETIQKAHPDPEKFALAEYGLLSHTFSSGLNTMAALLPLFFTFTGAVLFYVGVLFTDLTKPETHRFVIFHQDFRVWQIYLICTIALVFTFWSLGFVLAFRAGTGKVLQRASEIEALFPDMPAPRDRRLFVVLNNWYGGNSFSSLRLLYFSTVVFYVLIVLSYVAILVSTFMAHTRWQ